MKYPVTAFLLISLFNVPSAFAAERPMVACIASNTGAVTVRSRCRATERKMSLASLQVVAQSGPKGDQGLPGVNGTNGLNGVQGQKGDKGDAGEKGDKGDKGDRGDVGPVGATGAAGATGATGAVGPMGPVGPAGIQGVAGPVGPVGAMGPVGPAGAIGPVGPQGAVGPVGPQGAVGSVGPQGIPGVQGVQGVQGEQGPRGFSGFSTIPSLTTIYGVVGGDYHSATAGGEWGATTSIYGIPPVSFGNELVQVKNNVNVDNECSGSTCLAAEELNYQQFCNGTAEAPLASPGWLCIYPTQDTNASQVRAISVPNGSGTYGFTVKWVSASAGRTIFRGVWAYTAP